jgi:hypothetical protein
MWSLLLACSLPPQVETAAVLLNPLTTLDRAVDRTPVTAAADEVRAAGGYEYVRLGDRWVVGLAKGVRPGERVTATPIGRTRDFASRRTGHRYDELWFVVLAPVSSDLDAGPIQPSTQAVDERLGALLPPDPLPGHIGE